MANPMETLLRGWADIGLDAVGLQVNSLEKWLYKSYEPDKFGIGDFQQRLVTWLDNVPSHDDKKNLFRLIPNLLYFGPVEFEELYRCAYQGPIARWLIASEGIDICDAGAHAALVAAAKATWFCPISDSFRINSFFHINNLAAGASLRPDWRSMHQLTDPINLKEYCDGNSITRLVLLEDFVGGGSQAEEAVRFAATQVSDLQVLFVPLIVCPDGATLFRELQTELQAARKNSLTYEAVLELPNDAFLTETNNPFAGSALFASELRSILLRTYGQLSGGAVAGPTKPYHPFGYPDSKPTGGLVVMYSNTPDNTLPIVHWRPKTESWNPIFPRHSRD